MARVDQVTRVSDLNHDWRLRFTQQPADMVKVWFTFTTSCSVMPLMADTAQNVHYYLHEARHLTVLSSRPAASHIMVTIPNLPSQSSNASIDVPSGLEIHIIL